MDVLTQQNNQYVELDGACDGTTQNNPSPTYYNNATGTVQILNPTGTPVAIGAGNVTSLPVSYVATSNGNYRALITSAFNPPVGPGYRIIWDLATGGGAQGHWERPATVMPRRV